MYARCGRHPPAVVPRQHRARHMLRPHHAPALAVIPPTSRTHARSRLRKPVPAPRGTWAGICTWEPFEPSPSSFLRTRRQAKGNPLFRQLRRNFLRPTANPANCAIGALPSRLGREQMWERRIFPTEKPIRINVPRGFEPRLTVSETGVLPLDDRATASEGRRLPTGAATVNRLMWSKCASVHSCGRSRG